MVKDRSAPWLAILGLTAVLVLAVYWGQLQGPFIFDDHLNIVDVPAIQIDDLSVQSLKGVFTGAFARTRPVANLTLALNHLAGGLDPSGYKATNLAIHLLALAALFLVSRELLRRLSYPNPELTAAAACALWALNPVQTQSVSYVVQRMTSLSALFFLAAFYCYLRGSGSEGRGRPWYLAALGAWAVSLLSKEVAITLPLVLLAYEYAVTGRLTAARLDRGRLALWVGGVLLGCAAIGFAVGGAVLQGILADLNGSFARFGFTPGERLLTQPRVLLLYVSLFFLPLPSRMSLDHDIATSTSLFAPLSTLPALLAVLAALAGALALARRYRLASFCVLWFLATSAVEASFLPLDMIFEHRLYLPSMGLAWLGALGLERLAALRSFPTAARYTLLAAAVSVLSVLTFQRNLVWRDSLAMWADAAAKAPGKARPHNHLGKHLLEAGNVPLAVAEFQTALRADPKHVDALNNLGVVWRRTGRPSEAESAFREVLREKPDSAEALNNLGHLLGAQGRLDEALSLLQRAIALRPNYAEAWNNLGNVHSVQGRLAEAAEAYGTAIRLRPAYKEARFNRALSLWRQGNREAASAEAASLRLLDERLAAALEARLQGAAPQ